GTARVGGLGFRLHTPAETEVGRNHSVAVLTPTQYTQRRPREPKFRTHPPVRVSRRRRKRRTPRATPPLASLRPRRGRRALRASAHRLVVALLWSPCAAWHPPADVAVTLFELLSVCCTYAHGERTLLGRHTTNLTVFADATGARTRALRIGIRTAA